LKWSDLQPLWQSCLEEAWQAFLHGTVPIGAVIANANGEILARGRNHIYDDSQLPGQVSRNQLAHAELNALLHFDRIAHDPHTSSIYTSLEPCPLCMGAIYMMGIRHVHYAARDNFAGSTNLLGVTPYLSKKDVRVYGPLHRDVEGAVIALQVLFGLQRTDLPFNSRASEVFAAWEQTCPEGVALGRRLYQRDIYNGLRQNAPTAKEGFDLFFAELDSGLAG
jgi:tRNA(Arg) A34 adenosine deaminase TadA